MLLANARLGANSRCCRPDVDDSFNADQIALSTYATQYTDQVYAVTVGSETLYRGNFTGAELLEKINDVKAILPNTLVGTADSWNKYADGTADALIKGGVKLLMANAFAYWQGKEVGQGAEYTYFDDVQQAMGHIQQVLRVSITRLVVAVTDIASDCWFT